MTNHTETPMQKDNLIERLRASVEHYSAPATYEVVEEAADEIARLKGENERWQKRWAASVEQGVEAEAALSRNQALIEEMVEGLDEAIQALAAAGSKYRDASLDVAALRARTLIAKATEPDHASITPAAPSPPPDESPRPDC